MAKLYAELTSDKNAKVISKGGNEYIEMRITTGNSHRGTLTINNGGIMWQSVQTPLLIEEIEKFTS